MDNAPDTAASLGVMSIPVIIFFKDGKEAARIVGGNRDKIAGEMDKLL